MITSLQKKKPDASFFKLESMNFSEGQLDEFISSQGLFEQKYIVQMDGLLDDKKSKDIVLDKLNEIAESENIFVIIEDELAKTVLKKVEKLAQKVQEFGLVSSKTDGRKFGVLGGGELNFQDFNIFSLGDAFGNRDKKNFWVLYQKAKKHNIPVEEIHGILLWQLKSIFVAKNSASAGEAGLKHFVYNKSQRFGNNFSNQELQKISSDLVSMYHDARRGILDFDITLEKFILSI